MKRNKKTTDIELFTENLSNSKRQYKMLDSTVISRISCWQIFIFLIIVWEILKKLKPFQTNRSNFFSVVWQDYWIWLYAIIACSEKISEKCWMEICLNEQIKINKCHNKHHFNFTLGNFRSIPKFAISKTLMKPLIY